MLITRDFFAKNMKHFVHGGTTTYVIVEELLRRQYKVEMPYWPLRTLEFTDKQGRKRTTSSVMNWHTPALARMISGNKYIANSIAKEHGLPSLDTELYETADQARDFWHRYEGNVILKSIKGAGGSGVWTEFASLDDYVEKAKLYATDIQLLLQVKSPAKIDVRLLFIDNKLIAVTVRRPAYLIGDGLSTVRQLVDNENIARTELNVTHHSTMALALLGTDHMRENFGIEPDYVLASQEQIQATLANIAGGGLAEDYTDTIHSDFVGAGQTMVAALRCPVLAVDFLCDDPTVSFNDNATDVLFLETNANPGIDLHQYPHVGKSRNVASAYIDYLLEQNV